jgi:hypothetical protein
MPYGALNPGDVSTAVGAPPALIGHAAAALDADVTVPRQLGAGPDDLWVHHTLEVADLVNLVRTHIPATKLVLLERDGIPVYLTFGRPASSHKGSYDLLHPGSGTLVFAIPPTTDLGLMYGDGAPTNPLELWLLAGPSAVR